MHVVSVVFGIHRPQNVKSHRLCSPLSSLFNLRFEADKWQNFSDKPDEQSQACLNSDMARKGGRWAHFLVHVDRLK